MVPKTTEAHGTLLHWHTQTHHTWLKRLKIVRIVKENILKNACAWKNKLVIKLWYFVTYGLMISIIIQSTIFSTYSMHIIMFCFLIRVFSKKPPNTVFSIFWAHFSFQHTLFLCVISQVFKFLNVKDMDFFTKNCLYKIYKIVSNFHFTKNFTIFWIIWVI